MSGEVNIPQSPGFFFFQLGKTSTVQTVVDLCYPLVN